MPSTQHEAQASADREKQSHQQLRRVIGEQVMRILGQPSALQIVQVRKLWDDHYRVNVIVGANAACAKVAHSYFLVTNSEGNIIASTPKVTRQYLPTDQRKES